MSRSSYSLRLVSSEKKASRPLFSEPQDADTSSNMFSARSLSDKALLLRPLKDEHLLEVYREAKKMNLSSEFIELLEEAIEMRELGRLKA
ncbi:sporulation histidine kinase inhibitor Sda [Cohnella lubricantis]|nr:sporulation histidine kinase inhibitor Sda [Cohnella lubricantis]MBP2120130.1 hypothetical protein [Cohnella lubricantis]